MGLMGGWLILTRPQFCVFVLILFAYQIYLRRSYIRDQLVFLVTPLAVCALIINLWALRNYVHFKRFVPVSATGGISLLWGNNPRATGGWMPDRYVLEYQELLSNKNLNAVDRDQAAKKMPGSGIKENPKRFMELILLNSMRYGIATTWGLFFVHKGLAAPTF